MNDLYNTLLDIARTAVEHDPTLLNRMPCSVTDGPRHPDEDAEYYADQEELDRRLEQERQNWWLQQDMDEEWINSFDNDFAEYQGKEQ